MAVTITTQADISKVIDYLKQYGVRYAIRHIKLPEDIIKQIADGEFSTFIDDDVTVDEIIFCQQNVKIVQSICDPLQI